MILIQVASAATCMLAGAYAGLMASHFLVYTVSKRVLYRQLDEQLQGRP